MKYSIDKIMGKKIKHGIKPLDIMRSKNNLDMMTIEDYLIKYNPDKNMFTLKELIFKLESNCKIYSKGKEHGEEQIFGGYISEKINRHFTELIKGKQKTISNRKYKIIFAVDNRDLASYATEANKKILRNANSKRKRILNARYNYSDPLNRIHGFMVLDDAPCLCKPKKSTYLSIVIICANSHSSKSNIKAVGAYLLMFVFIMAYQYKFHKIILEVTNDMNDIKEAIRDQESPDTDSEDESDGGDEEDESDAEDESDGGDEEDESDAEDESDGGDEEDESDSEDESDDGDESEGGEDTDEGSETGDSDEDGEGDDNKCCGIKIKNNLMCNADGYYDDVVKDKTNYLTRQKELELHSVSNLIELCECYSIDLDECYNNLSLDKLHKLIKEYTNGSRKFKQKNRLIKELRLIESADDELLKKRYVQCILGFEFWNFNEYEDPFENLTCDIPHDFGDLDPEVHGYGGDNYTIGKNSTKDLYCNFYEKHGFIEDATLNTVEKCFTGDPLPSMYINIKKTKLKDLIKVFIERKYFSQTSDYCGANIAEENIIIK